jgi:WD40 repeat protein
LELLARLARPVVPPSSQQEQLEQVAADICSLLDANAGSDEVVAQLFDAFMLHVFGVLPTDKSELTVAGAPQPSSLLYVFLLSRLQEPYRSKLRDLLVPAILKFLTVKRPIDCDRREFFAHAEAFAALVKLEFVSVTGAVTTVTTLLREADTRCAAITMLGKTVELCLTLLAEKCDPVQLAALRQVLRSVADEAFRYDISYIQENMGWTEVDASKQQLLLQQLGASSLTSLGSAFASGLTGMPLGGAGGGGGGGGGGGVVGGGFNLGVTVEAAAVAAAAAAAAASGAGGGWPSSSSPSSSSPSPSAGGGFGLGLGLGSAAAATPISATTHSLVATRSCAGHTSTIFALGYDSEFDLLISSGKDSQVIAWSPSGAPFEKVALPEHYACSIDVDAARRQLLVCGVVNESRTGDVGASPAVFAYSIGGTRSAPSLSLLGRMDKPDTKLVSCVKALPGTSVFVTGESSTTGEAVCCYESGAPGADFRSLMPVCRFVEHTDIITSLTCSAEPAFNGLFFSGSRDCTIRIWDRRQKQCVGQMLGVNGTAAHAKMITCLDANAGLIVSAGLDKLVKVWDVRRAAAGPVRSIAVDDNAILKVAVAAGGTAAAVSTLRRLYLVDLVGDAVAPVEAFEQRHGRYHDLKFSLDCKSLFAAGDDQRVDVFSLTKRK